MRDYLNEYYDLYLDILQEFENIKNIKFEYQEDEIYELPKVGFLGKWERYIEYAIVEVRENSIIGISLDDESEEVEFHKNDIRLADLIPLFDYANYYSKQLNNSK